MNIEQFVRDRRPVWDQLEKILVVAERSPEADLGHERIRKLVTLYRQACSDLNHARALTANPEILDHLNQLTGRAYRFVYRGGRTSGLRRSFWKFVWIDIPAAFQKERGYVVAAFLSFALGAVFGAAAVFINPANGEAFIPSQFFSSSPAERVHKIETGSERIDTAGSALIFGTQLFTHNIQVTFLAFSAGALTILGGVGVLFYNGIILGAVGAMYFLDGVEVFFLAWVGPHGALELPAIIFAGAAGLRAGRAVLLPGNLTREAAVRAAFPSIWRMMTGAALILVIAGLIEGSFSQFSTRWASYGLKISVAVVLFVSLMVYMFVWKRTEGVRGEGSGVRDL